MISLNRTRRNLMQCIFALLAIVLLISICGKTVLEVQADEPVVVVIDPGHGGENLGGEYEEYIEKEMTMIVANAMKEELEKYDGIQVYMTRYGDIEEDMSLEERSEYAKSVDADFMFCLHFNLSEHHTLFGAECWVSAFGEQYSKGYSFASVEMELLQELGLYSRGIKTRLNDKGTDYYGIIRTATEREIPCVLIEHCFLDQENDQPFYDYDEKLKVFGRLDATAVAKYFNLRSEELAVDYSDYQNVEVPVPTGVVKPDMTETDVCMIDVLDQNMETGEVTVQVSAMDYDSGMLYYEYSYDNGVTFSPLQKWGDKSQDTITFTMQVPPHIVPQIIVNGYNGYDLYTETNVIEIGTIHSAKSENIEENMKKNMEENTMATTSEDVISLVENEPLQDAAQQKTDSGDIEIFLFLVFAILLVSLGIVFTTLKLMFPKKKHRKH